MWLNGAVPTERRKLRRNGDVRWDRDNVLGSEVLVNGRWIKLGSLTQADFEALARMDGAVDDQPPPGASVPDHAAATLKRAVTHALAEGHTPADVRRIVNERLKAFAAG